MRRFLLFITSSAIFTLLLVVLSFLINELWLGKVHDEFAFFRSETDWRVNPGLLITSFVWAVLLHASYLYFGERIRIENRFLQGMVYGLLVYIFFVAFQEIYYYQFISFNIMITVGSLVHYFLTFTLGGGLMAVFLKRNS